MLYLVLSNLQFTIYINVSIAPRYGTFGHETGPYSLWVNKQSWGNLMDVICLYENTLRLSLYMLINELTLNLKNGQFVGQDKLCFPKSFISNSSFR